MDKNHFENGIVVKNAGLVMLNNYFEILFERLGLLREKEFLNLKTQDAAVHYLQFLATGISHTEEVYLPLNKVLCGFPVQHPITEDIEITEEQIQLIEGLIKAAIDHWAVIGDTSVDGFRGNWLVRDGILTGHADKWELIVEKRAYDILLNQAPFSFSIIKYPWMAKPLHVNWNY
ncbi:MAG: hypothetical protein IPL84_01810 [Chitinophagaceae bacterium]|nr:hypothetical protein [Chitinophagaceae bacterium]